MFLMIHTKQIYNGRLNEIFFELMEKLSELMLKKGEPFRARAYQKAQETILAYPDDIINPQQLKGKPNIGPTITDKLNEYVETGALKVLEIEKNNPVNIFAEVYGIGPKKAKELVENNITSIDMLRENEDMLNDVQKKGLYYYEDILKRIPRSEIKEYENIFKNICNHEKTKIEIVGSYRRGSESSGDIDVIITSEFPDVFINFIDELIRHKLILEVLSRGPSKCLVIGKIPSSFSARRVDFLYASPETFPFAILYFTGSKIFNTVMRNHALQMGFTMNEHGLYKIVNGKKGEKVDNIFKNEKDIFNYLNMEYKTPLERIDSRSLVIKPFGKKIDQLQTQNSKNILIIENDNKENDIISIVNNFKKNGISVFERFNEKKLVFILQKANKSYYNDETFITDNEYDILKEYIEKKYPTNNAINQIGCQVPLGSRKVELPYFMGSMDKIKPDTNALTNWVSKFKGPYVLSCKLDGVSGLYTTEGKVPKLYTRGDGNVGQDISHIISYLNLPKIKNIVIRGEFIISKDIFNLKYKTKFANPRNMVSGIINHKNIIPTILNDLRFVAYEVIKPIKTPSEQLVFLSNIKVETVLYKFISTLSNDLLSQTLINCRKDYAYEIDGIIVANDAKYERKDGNPEHAFAFKMVLSEQIAEAKVVDVIWTPSKDGYLKPRVQIEPINLGGVRIEYATGFNGAFIYDNKVGVGAIIELIRSGDVIPHIRKVTVNAEEPKMPSVSYKWNDTNIDIMLEDIESDETVKEKNITGFFRGIGVEGLSSGNVSRIIEAGFDSVPKIIKMSVNDFLKVDGFKEKTANKLYNGIKEKTENACLVTIMSASNIFGRGFSEKKMELIMENYPDVLLSKETDLQKVVKISEIKGMAVKTAEAFVDRIRDFIYFIKEIDLIKKMVKNKKIVNKEHPLFGKTIVMSGVRDNDLQENMKLLGVKIGSSVSKNTFIVIVKDKNETTSKIDDAKKYCIPLITLEEFKEHYF